MAKQLRGLIVNAAAELSHEVGWPAVTMVRLAQRVGVSRQTLYNEVGSKAQLAQLVVLEANARLVRLVDQAFASSGDTGSGDTGSDVRRAVRGLVTSVAADPMLQALVAGLQGVESSSLPLRHPLPQELLDDVAGALVRNLGSLELELDEDERGIASSALVRLVLCAAIQPGSLTARAADDLAWVAGRLLRPRP